MAIHPLEAVPEGLRHAVRRHTPGWVWYRLQRATSYLEGPLDPTPLRRLETETLDRLRDPHALAEEILPEMGLTSLNPELYPPRLRPFMGRGVQSIQFPNQLGPYLAAMTALGIESYLEVGVEHGGTFAITVEILRRFGLRRALAVDLGPTPLLLRRWERPEVTFAAMNSHSPAFAELLAAHGPFDLALIDGDHSEEGVRQDFETIRPHARVLALHDIVEDVHAGVGRVWRAIRQDYADEYEFREFTAQYPELGGPRLGIGVAVRRGAV